LSNLKIHYANSAIRDKQQLISSIFPEKFEFDGKKCRTTRINDVLRYMLLIDSDLQNKKSGQLSKKIELSTLVESERIELSSKQATKELSTRLSSDLVFDKKQGQRQPLPA
jgi:site-specific DNA recombinase